jgi:hypothetical protein
MVAQHNPDLSQLLADPATRVALLDWLSSDAAWDERSTTLSYLEFLRVGASDAETATIRSFLLHPDPTIRSRAYEFLLTLYYPDRNREAMLMLFQNMLADESDTVRSLAAHYIRGIGLSADLRNLLERWLKTASAHGWQETESYKVMEGLLRQ